MAVLCPLEPHPNSAGASRLFFEAGGELPLKKPELQQVNKEKLKGQIFVADTFLFCCVDAAGNRLASSALGRMSILQHSRL